MAEKAKPTTRDSQIPKMFKDSFVMSDHGRARRAVAFPIAFLFHASLVAAMIVMPLLDTTNLPTVEVYSAFL
ncbi:hypothetical protein ACFLT9_11050, partial [Acidobacteriota bacterium]